MQIVQMVICYHGTLFCPLVQVPKKSIGTAIHDFTFTSPCTSTRIHIFL